MRIVSTSYYIFIIVLLINFFCSIIYEYKLDLFLLFFIIYCFILMSYFGKNIFINYNSIHVKGIFFITLKRIPIKEVIEFQDYLRLGGIPAISCVVYRDGFVKKKIYFNRIFHFSSLTTMNQALESFKNAAEES